RIILLNRSRSGLVHGLPRIGLRGPPWRTINATISHLLGQDTYQARRSPFAQCRTSSPRSIAAPAPRRRHFRGAWSLSANLMHPWPMPKPFPRRSEAGPGCEAAAGDLSIRPTRATYRGVPPNTGPAAVWEYHSVGVRRDGLGIAK